MQKPDLVKRLLFPTRREPPTRIPPGLYHYMREADGTYTRFHLRVEPDGRGMLLANSATAARLSQSGVELAKGILDEQDAASIIQGIMDNYYGVSRADVEADFIQVRHLIADLAGPGDNYPIYNLEDPALTTDDIQLLAPWHADMNCSSPDIAAPILDRLWEIGIPHVTLFIREAFDANDLVLAIERAEDLGMIAGVRGRATDLAGNGLLNDLATAGIDHVTLLYASHEIKLSDELLTPGDLEHLWHLYRELQELEVARVAEIPLTRRTIARLESSLQRLQEAGISNVNFTAYVVPDSEQNGNQDDYLVASNMPQVASLVEEASEAFDVRYIWQPPVGSDPSTPIREQILIGPRCTEDTSIRVKPNGDVIPPRGPELAAGNILTDPWHKIWDNPVFLRYRERVERPTRCDECPGLAICAVDCPRKVSGWSTPAGGYQS